MAYCHDAFVNEELEYYELLGFCAEGEAERLVADGATGPGGRIPFNTDGGLLARGHPGGPTGLAMIHEAVLQLRGEADGRQVDGARRGARPPRRRRQRRDREPAAGRRLMTALDPRSR